MLVKVPTVKTSVASTEMAKAFIQAWIAKFATTPKKESIAILYAHNYIETGGNAFCWNFNIANVKAVDSPGQEIDFMELANIWEIDSKGVKHVYQPPSPQTWFRAFSSLEDGVSFYMDFLRNNRYRIAWQAVIDGNPTEFATLLKKQGYYTAPVEQYISAMVYQFNSFMKMKIYEETIQNIKSEFTIDPSVIYHPMPDPIEYSPLFPEDNLPLSTKKGLFGSLLSKVKKLLQ